eukprot:gene12875-11761_t
MSAAGGQQRPRRKVAVKRRSSSSSSSTAFDEATATAPAPAPAASNPKSNCTPEELNEAAQEAADLLASASLASCNATPERPARPSRPQRPQRPTDGGGAMDWLLPSVAHIAADTENEYGALAPTHAMYGAVGNSADGGGAGEGDANPLYYGVEDETPPMLIDCSRCKRTVPANTAIKAGARVANVEATSSIFYCPSCWGMTIAPVSIKQKLAMAMTRDAGANSDDDDDGGGGGGPLYEELSAMDLLDLHADQNAAPNSTPKAPAVRSLAPNNPLGLPEDDPNAPAPPPRQRSWPLEKGVSVQTRSRSGKHFENAVSVQTRSQSGKHLVPVTRKATKRGSAANASAAVAGGAAEAPYEDPCFMQPMIFEANVLEVQLLRDSVEDAVGLIMEKVAGGMRIKAITPGTVAAKHEKLQPGQLITKVNGISLATSAATAMQMLKRSLLPCLTIE